MALTINTIKKTLLNWKERFFPERQLFVRSQGHVRFITLKSSVQISATFIAIVAFAWSMMVTVRYLTRDLLVESQQSQITALHQENDALNADFDAISQDMQKKAEELEKRQQFLAESVESIAKKEPVAPTTIDTSTQADTQDRQDKQASDTSFLEKIIGTGSANASNDMDRRSRLQQVENTFLNINKNQQILAEKLVNQTNQSLSFIDETLEETPLNIANITKNAEENFVAMGGPLDPIINFTPIFAPSDADNMVKLRDNLLRLEIATSALQSFPTGEPAEAYYISSQYGVRTDPFTKQKARHPGLDMAGWPGTAIWATNDGIVIKAGTWGAYGQMVEIDHGNGIHTRYGHMKKLHVKKGDTVKKGQHIGDMGKTGRATSSHLHYEIWYDDKVHDPLPFLKAADNVRKIQGRYDKKQ